MGGKGDRTRKRKSVDSDHASDKKKKKLMHSNKNEDELLTEVPETATTSKKRQKKQQEATLDTEIDSATVQGEPQTASGMAVTKKKLKKKQLLQDLRKDDIGPKGLQKKKKKQSKRVSKLNEVCRKAKKLWEKGRRLDVTEDENTSLTAEVYAGLQGKLPQVIYSHDMARVVQWLIKHSSDVRVQEIATECAESLLTMAYSKYAKYCVQALMRQRNEEVKILVVDKLLGNVVNLTTHLIAASIVGEAYERCANNLLKQHMKQEIYSSLFTKDKSDQIKDLKDMFEKYPELEDSTLSGMSAFFKKVFRRKLHKSFLIHDVLLDFLEMCSDKMGAELSPFVLQSGSDFATSKNGGMALIKSFSLATEEERRQFLENLQESAPKLACSEPGHFLLSALFTYVDDISIMKETVLKGLIDQLPELGSHVYGIKVLLHIVSDEKLPSLPPRLTNMLKLDLERIEVYKNKRVLQEVMLTPLLASVTSKPEIWLADGPVSVVTWNVLKSGKGSALAASFKALAKYVATSTSTIKHYGQDYTVVEHPGIHKILGNLINYDPLPSQEVKGSFATALMAEVTDTTMKRWLSCNRGCYMLFFLLSRAGDQKLKKKIESGLTDTAVKTKVETFSGGGLLLGQLKKLNSGN